MKKLISLFLCHIARSDKSELVLLSISTLLRDYHHQNPFVRGLALRVLSSLSVKQNVVETILPMIVKGFTDTAPYVRKTAALGAVRLFRDSPATVRETSIVDSLYDMLRDRDADVVMNAIYALEEILEEEGGMATNPALIRHLLSRLSEFNEWHQILVLRIVYREYVPSTEEEVFQLMNLLDELLSHGNHAVVMTVASLFLKYTQDRPSLYQDVLKRLHNPLVTGLGREAEIAYETIQYIHLVLDRQPDLFENDFKQFYPLGRDPEYLVVAKLGVLSRVAASWSAPFIVDELSLLSVEHSPRAGAEALAVLGDLAIRFGSVIVQTFGRLLELLRLQRDWLTSECLRVIANLLRKYPMEGRDVVTECKATLEVAHQLEQGEGKNAAIWMLGEFGEQIATAPYVLEIFVDLFEQLDHSTWHVLLVACVKLFGKRPAECQPILGDLLALCREQSQDMQLRYLAGFYYRFLAKDVHKALEVVNQTKDPIDLFVDQQRDSVLSDQLFEEFSSLAVVYQKPCSAFPAPYAKAVSYHDEEDEEEEEEEEEEYNDEPLPISSSNEQNASGSTLLPRDQISLNPAEFEQKWQQLPVRQQRRFALKQGSKTLLQDIEQFLEKSRIFVLASGQTGKALKIYAYAALPGSDANTLVFFLVQLEVGVKSLEVTLAVKSELDGPSSGIVVAHFCDRIAQVSVGGNL